MSARSPAIAVGDKVTEMEVVPDLQQVVRYCGLTWDAPRFFFDPEAARAQGLPGTIIPGPMKLTFLHRAVEQWLGDRGIVRHVRAAHRRPDPTGARLVVTGEVTRCYEEDGHSLADLELRILQEGGDASVHGTAVVQLTARE